MPVFELSARQSPVMSLSVFCASPDWTLCKMWNGIFVWDCTGHVHIVSGWNLEFC